VPRPKRPENAGLPKRWRYQHGAYYYQVPPGQEHAWDGKRSFLLGRSLPEAHRAWADRVEAREKINTVGQLFEQYEILVVPADKPATARNKYAHLKTLSPVFSAMPIRGVKPRHVYKYHHMRGANTAAKREVETLSHVFTKAVEWGLLDAHPFKNEVTLRGGKARDRYVEEWEITEIAGLKSRRKKGSVRVIQAYIALKLITGLRRKDLLSLRTADLRPDGLWVKTSKTGKPLIFERTEALELCWDAAIDARPVDISPYVFCTRTGDCYIDEDDRAEGWSSMWQRFMKRVVEETAVTERFTDLDLRGKAATDAESLERAQQLLGHTDSRTTKRHYRRKPERIRPLK